MRPLAASDADRGSGFAAGLLRAAGVLLMLTALAVALSRAPDRDVQTLVARWAPPPSDFIDVRGQVVHVRDEGPRDDPAPIVLLHGAASSLHTWDGWARALKGSRRVVRFDLPGAGLTGPYAETYAGRPLPGDPYGAESAARFTLEVLDALGIGRAVVGGNSLGGEAAWRAALLAPQRVAGLVLVDAAGTGVAPLALPLGFRVARNPVLGRIAEWLLPRAAVAQSLTEVYGDPARITTELVDRHFELLLRSGNRRALRQALQGAGRGTDAARLAEIGVPTLLLWGGRDRLTPPAAAQEFTNRIRGARLVAFPALGHVPHEEDPAQTVAPLREFVAGLR